MSSALQLASRAARYAAFCTCAAAALRAASSACRACSASRSRSGLLRTFSSVNRFRAEMGGQFRMSTVSKSRSSAQAADRQH